jgi:hypothetical protein
VRLVHDVDLVAALPRRGVHGAFPELAGIVHAPVAGRVDLDDVEVGRPVPHAEAVLAPPARLAVRVAIRAVQRHREDPCRGGLADAPGTGQEIAVAHPSARDGAAQHGAHMVLHQEVGEPPWTILAS